MVVWIIWGSVIKRRLNAFGRYKDVKSNLVNGAEVVCTNEEVKKMKRNKL